MMATIIDFKTKKEVAVEDLTRRKRTGLFHRAPRGQSNKEETMKIAVWGEWACCGDAMHYHTQNLEDLPDGLPGNAVVIDAKTHAQALNIFVKRGHAAAVEEAACEE